MRYNRDPPKLNRYSEEDKRGKKREKRRKEGVREDRKQESD